MYKKRSRLYPEEVFLTGFCRREGFFSPSNPQAMGGKFREESVMRLDTPRAGDVFLVTHCQCREPGAARDGG